MIKQEQRDYNNRLYYGHKELTTQGYSIYGSLEDSHGNKVSVETSSRSEDKVWIIARNQPYKDQLSKHLALQLLQPPAYLSVQDAEKLMLVLAGFISERRARPEVVALVRQALRL